MFEKGKVQSNEEQFFKLQADVNNRLQGTNSSYSNGDKFYAEYSSFIQKLTNTFEGLQAYCSENLTNYARSQEEARAKATKDGDFSKNAEEFIRSKTEDLIKKNKYLDELKGKLKESLAAVDAKKIAKLKVKETPALNTLFSALFTFYYKDAKEAFDWSKFKKEVVEKDALDDFQARLVNADYTIYTPEEINGLVALKDDPAIKDFSTGKKEGAPVMELLVFLDYVGETAKVQGEINRLQDEIHRIKEDAPRRAEAAKTEANWAEVLQDNITHLDSLNSRVVDSAKPFGNEVERTNQMVGLYEAHKNQVRDFINKEYSSIQRVPTGVYNA